LLRNDLCGVAAIGTAKLLIGMLRNDRCGALIGMLRIDRCSCGTIGDAFASIGS
jgi:hypothetical protein